MAKGRGKVSDKDRGYKALITRLKGKQATVTVGVHEAEGSAAAGEGGGPTVLDVAMWNEFGTKSIPARSFIAAFVDEHAKEIEQDLKKAAVAVAKGQLPSMEVALERLGLKWVGDIRRRIKAHIPPPNAESTIAKKGSSAPLIDSGQLWTSILHRVNRAA